MKRKLNIILFILVAVMCCGLLAVQASAATTASGTCGDNLTWVLDSNGTLTISGTGEMAEYSSSNSPWYSSRGHIEKVIIDNEVTSIGKYAFDSCYRLTEIIIPNSVTTIGYRAFGGCYNLNNITLPNSVTTIEANAFSSCSQLKNITIGDNVTSIGSDVFWDCAALTEITVSANNNNYSSENGVLYNKNKTELLCCPSKTALTNVSIPDSVTSISKHAFDSCYNLIEITIPNSVTSIGSGAFCNCESLTRITISDNVTSIGANTFNCCYSLTNINIPNSVKSIGNDAFSNCNSLKTVIIGESVTYIGYQAFKGCSNLTSITIPDSAINIDNRAFYGCDNLTTVHYNGTEEEWNQISIGSNNEPLANATIHFYEVVASGTCGNNLTWVLDSNGTLTINGTGEMTNYTSPASVPWYSYRLDIFQVTISEGITYVSDYAFYNYSNITSIAIPSSVTEIGNRVFYLCTGLTSVDVDEKNANYSSANGVLFNKSKTVLIQYPCGQLSSLYEIPDSVTSIYEKAFANCINLTSVTLPNSVISIGKEAFYSCTELTNITIPDSVTSIGDSAFIFCSNLTSVTIGCGVTSIGEMAFKDCTNLTSVIIPNSVKNIERAAFYRCTALTDVYYDGFDKEWENIDIDINNGSLEDAKLHCKYKITYDTNGGAPTPEPQEVIDGKTIKLSNVIPTKEGYDFIGWRFYGDDTTVDYLPGIELYTNSSVTLYAVWQIKTYNVTYDATGGTNAPTNQTKTYGVDLSLSNAVPTLEGYTFKGWSTAKGGTAEYQPNSVYSENAELTLYAVWEIESYIVSYDANGGTNAPSTQTKTFGVDLNLSNATPIKAGHIFKGWSTEKDSNVVKYQPNGVLSMNGDVILYAVWQIETYSVSYDANGGINAPANQEKTYGVDLTLSNAVPTRDGYAFKGWSTIKDAVANYQPNGVYSENAELTLYAVWEINTYVITYNANGGSGAPDSQKKTHNINLKLSTIEPTKIGHIFKGWAISNSSSSVKYYSGDIYGENTDVTLYAVWEKEKYTITYNANGGTDAPNSQLQIYEEPLEITNEQPVKDGYTFMGWTCTSSSTVVHYQSGSTYEENRSRTLYAVWKANEYIVEYDANRGSNAPESQTKVHNVDLTLSDSIPSREGYTFVGWSSNPNATSAEYNAAGIYQSNVDVTLYAVWEINTYSIIYDANGGIGAPDSQKKEYGNDFVITSSVPTRDGYTFKGWALSPDSIVVSYVAGSIYSDNKEITLYAVWAKQLTAPTFSVTSFIGGKTIVVTAEQGTIYYTLDGSEPSKNSAIYSGEITLTETATIKAIVMQENCENSSIVEQTIVVDKTGTPELNCDSNSIVEIGTIVKLNNTFDSVYYSVNGNEFVQYTKGITLTDDCTIKLYAINSGSSKSEIVEYAFTIAQSEKPVINVTAVYGGKEISLSANEKDTIYYTLDGTVPDKNSNKYTEKFTVSEDTTITVVALRDTAKVSESTTENIVVEKAISPTFSINTDSVMEDTECELYAEGYVIYYTTDGTDPLISGKIYETPIVLTESVQIKAIAVKLGSAYSDISTKNISITKLPSITLELIEDNGDTVKIAAEISENPGISSALLKLKYPKAALSYIDIEKGTMLNNGICNVHETDDGLNILWINANNSYENGKLFAVNLSRNDDYVADVPISVTYSAGDIINDNFDDVNPKLNNASITLSNNTYEYGISILEKDVVYSSTKVDGKVTLNVQSSEGDKTADLIVAIYDEKGNLLNITSNDITLALGNNKAIVDLSATIPETCNSVTVKFLLWESVNSIKPLCTFEEMTISK